MTDGIKNDSNPTDEEFAEGFGFSCVKDYLAWERRMEFEATGFDDYDERNAHAWFHEAIQKTREENEKANEEQLKKWGY